MGSLYAKRLPMETDGVGETPPMAPGAALPERGTPPADVPGRWLILWDGECGFCRRSVEATLARDRRAVLAARPYQDCTDWLPQPVLARSPDQAHLRSPDGRYWGGGDAAIEVLALLGHRRLAALLRRKPLHGLVARGYRWVARHRGLMGRLFRPRSG